VSFATQLQQYGDQIALILESGEAISYKALARLSDSMFAGENAPEREGELIAVECRNGLASVAGYLGALRHGHPVLLIDAKQSNELRERLYAHFRIPYVLSDNGTWLRTGHIGPTVHADVALLLSTSGSTGSSKLVKLSHSAVTANAVSIAQYLALDSTERPVTTLPMHYAYGLSVLNSHFAVGATVLLTSHSIMTRPFWSLFREHAATSLSGVPMTYETLKQLHFERMDLPSLRTLTQAGGRLAPTLVQWFGEVAADRGWQFIVMYGQTEATARISYVPAAKLLEKTDSIGIAIPEGSLDIVDPQGQAVYGNAATGELRYRGPNVMMGYASSMADLALPDTQGGVLLTGDLAWRDADGYFHIVGRLQRFIKIFGNRLGLDEIEMQLQESGYDVAVTGRDDLLLIATETSGVDNEKILSMVSSRYRLPRSSVLVVSVDNLPRSSSGKILYSELLNQLTS
jgi:long-chain acyl-CoA synthetase